MSVILGYESPAGKEQPSGVRVESQGTHRLAAACKAELIAALQQLKPREGARLVVLGTPVEQLGEAERAALRARVAFVPAHGGLISNLNAWENISLPVGYHAPARLAGVPAQVRALLEELGGTEPDVLAKLPEHMTLYERRLAAYIRALLEEPQLLVAENLAAGLGPTKRKRAARFADTYHARCPGGTFVQLDDSRG
jgi:predicted ABC-type transport system involved in lysophospholipase L1 biosynthesis ATPase subunit